MELAGDELLQKVVDLPISTWSYDAEPGVVHVGPMAQDFRAAFNLGASDKVIATVDLCGVLYVAVQALCRRITELERMVNHEPARASVGTVEGDAPRSDPQAVRGQGQSREA